MKIESLSNILYLVLWLFSIGTYANDGLSIIRSWLWLYFQIILCVIDGARTWLWHEIAE